MGKGRPRAVEKGVPPCHGYSTTTASAALASAGPTIPSAPTYRPTEEEFLDPLCYIESIRPEAEQFGICRIIPPPSWSPPLAVDLSTLKFPTKTQSIHRLQSRPASCDSETFNLELERFNLSQFGRKPPRRKPSFLGVHLDLCKLFNAVKRFGGYSKVCRQKRWGDVVRLIRPRATITECSKHVLSQLYADSLCDYEDYLAQQPSSSDQINYSSDRRRRKGSNPEQVSVEENKEKLDPTCNAEIKPVPDRKRRKGLNFEQVNVEDNKEQLGQTCGREIKKLPDRKRRKGSYSELPSEIVEEKVDQLCARHAPSKDEDLNQLPRRRKRKKGSSAERALGEQFDQICEQCKSGLHGDVMLLCDRCDKGWHLYCLSPPLDSVPSGNWYCQECVNSDKDSFGFVPGKCCTVEEFKKMDERIRRKFFGQGQTSRVQIEKKFWEVVEGRAGEVEVMYGNDLDTSVYGSGFPRTGSSVLASVDLDKWQEYCSSPWNLNNLPKLQGSMLSAVHDNIAGVTIPWLYVGMTFSSFCWHVEDHCFYSINYVHWGEPKCWYGVPGAAANAFEEVMRKMLPDLFDAQPDLLFQLVTMLNPSLLQENGVPVYRVVQEPGNFVITFPRSFHGGFNFGINCAEAVNFATADWLPHGGFGAELYRTYRKEAIISHEELLCVAAKNGCSTRALPYLKEELRRLFSREKCCRENVWRNGVVRSSLMSQKKHPHYVGTEEDPTCIICQQYLYMSAIACCCRPTAFVCLEHWKHLCECNPFNRRLLYRQTLAELGDLLQMCSSLAGTSSHLKETSPTTVSDKPKLVLSESGPVTKKVKGRQISYTELAEDWLLNACRILDTSFSLTDCSSLLKEAEQFLWADHDMNPIRTLASKLRDFQKWGVDVRKCLSKLDSCAHNGEDSLQKVSLFEVEQLLSYDTFCCYEPLARLKAYADDAKMLVSEIENALSSHLHVDQLEELHARAVKCPIYLEEIRNLAKEISSAKAWVKSATKCLSEKRNDAIDLNFLKKLQSEMMELHVQLPEMKLLADLCSKADMWEVQCKEIMKGSHKLKEVEDFLIQTENSTVRFPELKLLQKHVIDTNLWISSVHNALKDIAGREDYESIVSELTCIVKSGEMLTIKATEEFHLVEAELKRSSCKARAAKVISAPMPMEFIQHVVAEAFVLGIENEILFVEVCQILKVATSWEEKANFLLSHPSQLTEFEDHMRISEDIKVDLPSFPLVKQAIAAAQSWNARAKPFLTHKQNATAAGSLLKVNELKELVAQSNFLNVTLDHLERLQSILTDVNEWECAACFLLQEYKALIYMHDTSVKIDIELSVRISDLLEKIDSATNIGHCLGFEFNDLPKLQQATLTIQWILKALSMCSRFVSQEEIDCLLEGLSHLPETPSGNTLTYIVAKGVYCLRKACTIVQESQHFRTSKLEDAEVVLEEIQIAPVSCPLMVEQFQNAISKHKSWIEQAQHFFQHPGQQSWSSLLKLKEQGKSDSFSCPERDKVLFEVVKVEKWIVQCRGFLEPVIGDLGSLHLELSLVKETLDRAMSIYCSSGPNFRSSCVCCPDISGVQELYTCLTCNDRYHFTCMGPPLATASTTNEYACPFCLHMENGTVSKHGGQPLVSRGNRPELKSIIQHLSSATECFVGIDETKLLEEVVDLALSCKLHLKEIVDGCSYHQDKDLSSTSESLSRALKGMAVAGIYDHESGDSIWSALSKNSWKVRVRNLLSAPNKPIIQEIHDLLREGESLNIPLEDPFMQEITAVREISLCWADLANKVVSDNALFELSEVFRLIDEGNALPVHFEQEMKLLRHCSVLFCICRKPYVQKSMIACDQCGELYHTECIYLQKPPQKMFICPACKLTNGDIISLPPSVSHGERLIVVRGPTTPSRLDKVKGNPDKLQRSLYNVEAYMDLGNIIRSSSEIDCLWRANKKRLHRTTRKRCKIESFLNFASPMCK